MKKSKAPPKKAATNVPPPSDEFFRNAIGMSQAFNPEDERNAMHSSQAFKQEERIEIRRNKTESKQYSKKTILTDNDNYLSDTEGENEDNTEAISLKTTKTRKRQERSDSFGTISMQKEKLEKLTKNIPNYVPPPPPPPHIQMDMLNDDMYDRNSIASEFDYENEYTEEIDMPSLRRNSLVLEQDFQSKFSNLPPDFQKDLSEALPIKGKQNVKTKVSYQKKVVKASIPPPQPAGIPAGLLNQIRSFKRDENLKVQDERMRKNKISTEQVLTLFEKRDFFPLSSFIITINQNTLFGDYQSIIQLSLTGIEQVTDMLFYHMMSHIMELPNLDTLNLSGCHNVTDAGMKWCAEQFPYLREVYLKGCYQVTERALYYFMDTPYSVIEYMDMTSTGCTIIPGKLKTLAGSIGVIGCPMISPSTEIYRTKKRSSLLDVNLEDLYHYKVVVLKEKDCPHSFISTVTKKPVKNKHVNVHTHFQVDQTDPYIYNIYEVEVGMGMEDFVFTNGGIVILTYSSIEPNTVNKLTNQMIYLLTKCPESVFVIADMSDTGGDTSASVAKEVINSLELWVEKFGAEHTMQLGDLMMEFTFQQQKTFVRALSVLESIQHIQKNNVTDFRCIVDADLSGGKYKPGGLKFLNEAVTTLREHYPWHGNQYHPMSNIWILKEFKKKRYQEVRVESLSDLVIEDAVKFNMNSRGVSPFTELDQVFKVRAARGECVYLPKITSKPAFYHDEVFEKFCNSVVPELGRPPHTAPVAGLGVSCPCFTRNDIFALNKGTEKENALILEILEDSHMIIKLPLTSKHPTIKESTVYVAGDSLPDQPHIPLDHFWDGKFTDQLYSGRKYRIPILPNNLLLIVISHLIKVSKLLLLWKDGAIMQQGPVTYRLELFRKVNKITGKCDYPGVLLEGRIHCKAKPDDERYTQADSIVWKGLRGIASVFESILMKNDIYFAGEYFYYQENIKFYRDEALEWFAGVREKPYMCDSIQKLVPNHASMEIEQGTRCYQCDNCGTNNIDCEGNMSNNRYRSECGCQEYSALCKTCGMCKHCVQTIARAITTIQPSFRMARVMEKENLSVSGSNISFGKHKLEYVFRNDMSYETFSNLNIVLLRGINFKIDLTNKQDGNATEKLTYYTSEGKIERISISSGEEKVTETMKERGMDCRSGFTIGLCFNKYDMLEIKQNSSTLFSWDLSGPFVQVAITAIDPGNIMVYSDNYVDFEDITAKDKSCCDMTLPSCVERKLTGEFKSAMQMIFSEGKDFSGAAACILPDNVTERDLLYPSSQILNKARVLMPLCLTKNRFVDEWYLASLAHMVNTEGIAIPDETSEILAVGMASNSMLSQYPYMNIPDKFERYLRDADGKVEEKLVARGMQEMLRLLSMDLILELGLNYTLQTQLPAQIRKTFMNATTTIVSDPEKSALHPTESIAMEGKILFLCAGHKASYQSRADFAELSPSMFSGYSKFIRDIKIVKTALVTIPDGVFEAMPHLVRCELYENLLERLPDTIGCCTKLQKLDIADNNLTDLPMTLVNCKQLTRIDIGRNMMTEVPKVITKLTWLKRLLMNNMLLTSLPEDIGNMEALEMFYAIGNCFSKLPKSIGKLKNLQDLSLAGVPWVDVKEGQHCTKQAFDEFLTNSRIGHWLDANNEDKAKVFSQFDLDANNVLDNKEMGNVNATLFNIFPRFGYKGTEPPDDDSPSGFPEEILELTQLRYLNLQFHGIVHIPESIEKMSSLETLVISHNPYLLSVAAKCGLLPLKRLDITNCPLLKTPPKEIRDRGFRTVKAYLRRLTTGSVDCQRTKLMFVGLGGAGKTSLAKALMTSEFQTSLTGAQAITDGIDICTWTVNHEGDKVQYSVWDFAGQTVYYNTHQFFLSDRAVYLLLWNVRLGAEHAGLNFWLSSIRVHASKAPVFIVGTHMDQVPKAELPIEEMMENNKQIEGCFFVSSYTGQGIEELKSELLKVTLRQEYMGEKIPAAYLDLENIILKKRQENVDLIEYGEVERMANNAGLVDKTEIAQAVQFLHDLGSIQHFTHEVLKSKVVINPQWIVDVMARVVSVKESPIEDGKLKHCDLGKVWKEYPANLHNWLLQLTEEFDLTFKLVNEKANLVPCLLPEKKPEIKWPEIKKDSGVKETKMVYHFEYLPAGLFNRAQVRLQEFSDSAVIWKRGSVLRKNEHIALLHHHKDTEMIVKVQGPRPENVLFLVHEVFEALKVESFGGVKYDFSVPCPDCMEMKKKDPHMFAASMIRRAIDLQAPFLQCLRFFHTISVGDLQSIMPPDTTQDYDIHLAHAVNDLEEFDKKETLDVFLSFCDLDAPTDKSKVIHPEDVFKELLKENYKCFYPETSKKYSTDMVAKSLIDSSIFVAFVSNNYVNDQACCNMFKFAKATLRKPFIIVAVGPDHEWKKSALGLLIADVVFVNMVDSKKSVFSSKMDELLVKIKEIYNVEVSNDHPPCFISYCWKNSKDAVEQGTKSDPQAYAYTPDPRDIASFLTANGVLCWLDIKRIGFGMSGLLDDIAKGLLNSHLMISFLSDDYAASQNAMTELSFAALTLKIPVILAVVGQGDKWKTSEANMLAFRVQCPVVDLRQLSENEGKEKLLSLSMEFLKDVIQEKEASDKKLKKKKSTTKEMEKESLSFQELYELAQRKFLHQITQYAQSQDTSRPYPRLFLLDVVKQEEKEGGEKKSMEEMDIGFRDGKYCLHTLCECETGWHPVANPILLEDDFGHQSLVKYTPYLSRITALMKHNEHFKMAALSDRHGIAYLRYLTETSAAELTECKEEYLRIREDVIRRDEDYTMGGLQRCRLPSGKIIWLCKDHISKMKVTVLTNEMIAHDKTTTRVVGTDHMLESLREMDPAKMKLAFKSAKKAKRERTAPKDAKEQVNIQKKQSLLRQKSLLNEELLAEYRNTVETQRLAEQRSKITKTDKPMPSHEARPMLLQEIRKRQTTEAGSDKSDKGGVTSAAKKSGIQENTINTVKPSTSGAAGSSQSKPTDRPKSDSNIIESDKDKSTTTQAPLTLNRMGRSKSKACSMM